MLKYVEVGTVFDLSAQTIVNTVNCEGFMGKGLALEVKKRFPEVFEKYRKACSRGELRVGRLQLVKTPSNWVLNFPTKIHWREKSKLEYLEIGLRKFRSTYKKKGITSIAFPPLGCGNGGLDWENVRPVMERYLKGLRGIQIFICLGKSASKHQTRRKKSQGHAQSFEKAPENQAQLPLAFA